MNLSKTVKVSSGVLTVLVLAAVGVLVWYFVYRHHHKSSNDLYKYMALIGHDTGSETLNNTSAGNLMSGAYSLNLNNDILLKNVKLTFSLTPVGIKVPNILLKLLPGTALPTNDATAFEIFSSSSYVPASGSGFATVMFPDMKFNTENNSSVIFQISFLNSSEFSKTAPSTYTMTGTIFGKNSFA